MATGTESAANSVLTVAVNDAIEHIMSLKSVLISFMFNDTNNVYFGLDRLFGLVVRVSGYRYRGPGFDSRCYQIF